ncbi:MAG: hypothetical protein OJF47_002176 [Nitrospira sp.]|nr:MAG: hypothetical protein OJF47_002176 [Nitrospira sp.]
MNRSRSRSDATEFLGCLMGGNLMISMVVAEKGSLGRSSHLSKCEYSLERQYE